MKLDMKKAFLASFSEEKWYIKLIFPTIVALLTTIASSNSPHIPKMVVVIVGILSIVPSIILSGFFMQFEHNEINDELPLLPALKSKLSQYGKYGLNSIGVILVYGLAIGLTLAIVGAVLMFVGVGNVLIGLVLFALFVFAMIVMGLAQSAYADEFKFKQALDVKRIFKLMPKVKIEILIYVATIMALILISVLVNAILAVTLVGLLLVPFVTVLIQFITLDLQAQVYKIAKHRLEIPVAIVVEAAE